MARHGRRRPGVPLAMDMTAKKFKRAGCGGQSLVESCVVIGIICLFLMGLFQLSQLYMAREILMFAAGRGARARAVGFNDFMVHKTVRVASIPAAGRMLDRPDNVNNPSAQRNFERARIPLYLAEEHYGRLSAILDYTNWPEVSHSLIDLGGPRLDCRVRENFPVGNPVFRAFYRGEAVPLSGNATLENHYPLYLYNAGGAP